MCIADVPPGTFDEHNVFREYTGMMEFVKLPRLHSLARHTLDTHRYLFKRERRKFHVEKLHLPPGARAAAARIRHVQALTRACVVANRGEPFHKHRRRGSCPGCGWRLKQQGSAAVGSWHVVCRFAAWAWGSKP